MKRVFTVWLARLLCAGLFAAPLVVVGRRHLRGDDRLLLPGRTSDGHHQIESRCPECHTSLAGVSDRACLRCHGESLAAGEDSHAVAKFDDPGKAAQLRLLDARTCLTCHREHRPEARAHGSLTVAPGFCLPCHANVARERPSHAGFGADGCATAGCHNYHDNRSLYRDFLVKHRDEPDLREDPRVPIMAASPAPVPPPLAEVPSEVSGERPLAEASREWLASAHARAAVGCPGCHQPVGARAWRWTVDDGVCASCHDDQRAGFYAGKHGMRLALGLAAMSPGQARLTMRPEAAGKVLGCTTCHRAHRFNQATAAVTACESCHDDVHTIAFQVSPHFAAWQRELAGEGPPGSGVSCATCHLPRQSFRRDNGEAVRVQHDQSANLRPSDRMAREVCLSCHGLAFSLAALADRALVGRNFKGQPVPATTGMTLIERGERDGK